MMSSLRAAALLAASALVSAEDALLYVGSAGCDWDDAHRKDDVKPCEDNKELEQYIRPVLVDESGRISVDQPARMSIKTSGTPMWLTSSGKCLIATIAEKNEVLSINTATDEKYTASSGGSSPVYAAPVAEGRGVIVANYDKASVSLLALDPSTCEIKLKQNVPHGPTGSGVVRWRQEDAHVHSAVPARDGLAYVCDLGMDIIFSYRVSEDGLQELARTRTPPGSGPRHLVQHPGFPMVYVVSEMGQDVFVYSSSPDGKLTARQRINLQLSPEQAARNGLPKFNCTSSKAGEIVITEDGSGVFVTNRGCQDTVTAFEVDSHGLLGLKSVMLAPAYPRGMILTQGSTALLIAGQSKTEIWSYEVGSGGQLTWVSTFGAANSDNGLPPHPSTLIYAPVAAPAIPASLVV